MNNEGLSTTIEEGNTGQFELFRFINVENSDYWVSYMKEGIECCNKFFTIEDVQKKLG
jgi:hypothetical protein